jgi:YD repeat-containing protein
MMETLAQKWQRWTRILAGPRRKLALASLVVVLLFGLTATFVSAIHAAAPAASHPAHHTDPRQNATSVIHHPVAPKAPTFTASKQPVSIPRPGPGGMQPGTVAVSATQAFHFLGSDGRLEVAAPAGLFSADDIAQVGGIQAHISQIAAGSGSSAGGSGLVSLGTYLITYTDAKGNGLPFGPRQPVTLTLHYSSKEMAFDLDKAYAILNGSIPKGSVVGARGAYQSMALTHNRTAHTLSVVLAATGAVQGALAATTVRQPETQPGMLPAGKQYPPTTITFNTNSRVAIFGSPSAFNVDLNAGSLTDGVQLDVPPGPGGTLPNITLAYSSAGVSEQHDPQGAASWVGEGWNLSLGAITWAEHNVQQNTGGSRWQDSWRLTDPFGTSDELIPPATNISTFYDDTPNSPSVDVEPWHTASESHIKIYSMNSGLTIGMPLSPPCFRVFLQNGIMEEFGCTYDSLEYYYVPGVGDYIYGWQLDLITSPTGNQVQLTYQRDLATITWNGQNYTYPRDSELQSIAWDSPTCFGGKAASTGCPTAAQGGTSPNLWAPLDQVVFNASHAPSDLTNTPSGCNTGTNLRCDDALDLSGSNGIGVPEVINTLVLNNAQVQVNNSGTWHTLRTYQLYYEQSGPSTTTDPVTGKQESMAGMLDLTRIKEIGDDGSTAYPTTAISYATVDAWYIDSTYYPYSVGYCGAAWNRGNGDGTDCSLWSTTYANNDRYISAVTNNEGLDQTFQWDLARNNTHGVNSGLQPSDPLACTHAANEGTYPCDAADDQAWSRVVVVQRDDEVNRISQNGQGGQQTTTTVDTQHAYTYFLTYPLAAQQCGDCVAGMYWGNQNDGDYLDYYNLTFMGFNETAVSNPDGSLEYHHYYATHGPGVFDTSQVTSCPSNLPPITSTCQHSPWWDLTNAAHGREYEADYYDTNGTTLLKQVLSTYVDICPPSGVSGSPPVNGITWDGNLVSELDSNNPVAVCDVYLTQQVSKQFDGGSSPSTLTSSYTYDSYGNVTATTRTSNGGTPGTTTNKTYYTWNDALNPTIGSTGQVAGTYLIGLPAYTDTEDGSGNRLVCHITQYDFQGYTTGENSSINLGFATASNSYDSCGTSGNNWTPSNPKETTQQHDSYGNATASNDADANGGDTTHQGCTVSGTQYTECAAYDSTTQAKPTSSSNAKNQTNTSSYGSTPSEGNGYQQWLMSSTNANGQTTSYTYDALGRQTAVTAPGETPGDTTQSMTYTNWCAEVGPQTPCVEEDSTQRLDSRTTVTTRTFYDGFHHLVETRTPGPTGQDVVRYTYYDALGRGYASSSKYFVTAYTGAPGAAAYSIPDSTVATSQTTAYDGLSRPLSSVDAISETTTMAYSIVCNPVSGDTGCYEQSQATDANNHRTASLADALGQQTYSFTYTGTNPYTLYATTKHLYDVAGRQIEQDEPGGGTATWTYDAAGRVTQTTDPDQGTLSMLSDANGNLVEMSDPRGTSTGTVWYCYDGLNRKTRLITGDQCSSSPTLATWSYDAGTITL